MRLRSELRLPVKSRGANDAVSWTSVGTDHAITLTELTVNTSYWAYIGANETADVVLWFNTSNVVDETPPDVLNLAAEVLEDGRVIVSWYTSERATESVLINGESVHEDAFATKKIINTTAVLSDGTYDLEVVSADASGNLTGTCSRRGGRRNGGRQPPPPTTMRMRSPFRRFRFNDSTRCPCCCGAGAAGVPSGSSPRCR